MKKTLTFLAASFALAVLLSPESRAQLVPNQSVLIDYGAIVQAGADSNGNFWNNISVGGDNNIPGLVAGNSAMVANLVDASSASTGVSFSLTNDTGFWGWDFGNGTGGDGALIADSNVWSDGIISNDNVAKNLVASVDFFTLTFTGLNDALTYDLVTGYNRGDNVNFDRVTTAGGTTIVTNSGATVLGIPDPNAPPVDLYAEFTGLTSSGGVLSFTVTGENENDLATVADHVVIGATTLTAQQVPEPSSALALVGLGGAAFLRRRRS